MKLKYLLFPTKINSKESAISAAKSIVKDRKIIALITLGGMGVITWDGTRECYHPSYKVDIKDTTRTGEMIIGAFVVDYGKTHDLSYTLKFASATAAINITRIGASSANPTYKEVEKFLSSNPITL